MSIKYKAHFMKSHSQKAVETENRNAILAISVGRSYHESDKLQSTIDLVNKAAFKKCTIMVADTLQRHNYFWKYTKEQACKISYRAGTDWIERNQPILNKLTVPHEIVRWDALLEDSNLTELNNIFINEYNKDPQFYHAINETINDFFERKTNADQKKQLQFQNSLNYLFEECPIIMMLWPRQGYEYIIYPNKMSSAMKYCYEKFVRPHMSDKANWLPLRFKKKSMEPGI